ncbi:MAG: hypothetical protein FWG63_09310 [Defluviitaleaceae bacterium]|nr:hypothetical protein [Defluviitaleaceae bacterium]
MKYPISISISDNTVSVIKVNSRGIIVKSATAEIPPMPRKPDEQYTKTLSAAIKKARREAKLSWGRNIPAIASISDPNIVINHFVWPNLPHAALVENAKTEIVPYLYDTPSKFIVGAEIQYRKDIESAENIEHIGNAENTESIEGETTETKRKLKKKKTKKKTQDELYNIDVLVAAVPNAIASTIYSALRMAGYKMVRLNVRQNSWAKLIKKYHSTIITGDISTFALLHKQDEGQLSMSLFFNKTYYSTHYFDSAEGDYEAFADEINAIFDYIHYKEVGVSMEAILLIGDGFQKNTRAQLEKYISLPLFETDEWLQKNMLKTKMRRSMNINAYIDAFAATIPADIVPKKEVLNIQTPEQKTANIRKKTGTKIFAYSLVLAAIIFAVVFVPMQIQSQLETEYILLQSRLSQFPVTEAEIAVLNQRIGLLQLRLNSISFFHEYAPQALQMFPMINIAGFDAVSSIAANGHEVRVTGETSGFASAGQIFSVLQAHPLVLYARIENLQQQLRDDEVVTAFTIILYTVEGSGER